MGNVVVGVALVTAVWLFMAWADWDQRRAEKYSADMVRDLRKVMHKRMKELDEEKWVNP